MKSFLFGCLLWVSLLCVQHGFSQPSQGSPFRYAVTVEHLPKESLSEELASDKNRFRAHIRMSEPVKNFVFHGPNHPIRSSWHAVSKDLVITTVDGREAIVHAKGQPFSEAIFELTPYNEPIPKSEEFFQTFSDGSLIVFPFYFQGCPSDKICRPSPLFTFIPRSRENGLIKGHWFSQAHPWSSEWLEQTYVYFGNLKPLETPSMIVMLDPALPTWIYRRFYLLIPRLFEFYEEVLAAKLPEKPLIFFTYSSKGISATGNTLSGLINYSIQGDFWKQETEENFLSLAQFFAHELFHLWNRKYVASVPSDFWIHEGSADEAARIALETLGALSPKNRLRVENNALFRCMKAIEAREFPETTKDPHYRAQYQCGSVLSLVTDLAVRKDSLQYSDTGMFAVWEELLHKAERSAPSSYSTEEYLATLQAVSGNPKLVSEIQKLFETKGSNGLDSVAFFRQLFSLLGVQLKTTKAPPSSELKRDLAEALMKQLMKQDCQGSSSFFIYPNHIETEAMEECGVFRTSYSITHVEGVSLIRESAKTYTKAATRCKNETTLRLTAVGQKHPLTVVCPKELKPPPLYLQIMFLPHVSRSFPGSRWPDQR